MNGNHQDNFFLADIIEVFFDILVFPIHKVKLKRLSNPIDSIMESLPELFQERDDLNQLGCKIFQMYLLMELLCTLVNRLFNVVVLEFTIEPKSTKNKLPNIFFLQFIIYKVFPHRNQTHRKWELENCLETNKLCNG